MDGMYETFEHTADLGLRIRAADLDTLFAEAALALFAAIVEDVATIEPRQRFEIELPPDELDYLLFDWLRALLYRFDADWNTASASFGSWNTQVYNFEHETGQFGENKNQNLLFTVQDMKSDGYQTFNDQKRGRLNLIRHLLDHLPDRKLEAKPLKLQKLKSRLGVEKLADKSMWVKEIY